MAKYINVDDLNWYDDLFMKGENHSGVWVRYRDAEQFIKGATPADVTPTEDISDAVDEALCILETINTSGRLDYDIYSELYDTISNIYCSLKEKYND